MDNKGEIAVAIGGSLAAISFKCVPLAAMYIAGTAVGLGAAVALGFVGYGVYKKLSNQNSQKHIAQDYYSDKNSQKYITK
ncbi:MAG: hypothetical protein HUU50_12810 [Candidatus Brocadiae bacterium]|nr:hypothetical protein [Candidatus Brocadiia bacterium]